MGIRAIMRKSGGELEPVVIVGFVSAKFGGHDPTTMAVYANKNGYLHNACLYNTAREPVFHVELGNLDGQKKVNTMVAPRRQTGVRKTSKRIVGSQR